jgi:hypothetical protein
VKSSYCGQLAPPPELSDPEEPVESVPVDDSESPIGVSTPVVEVVDDVVAVCGESPEPSLSEDEDHNPEPG